MAEIVKGRCPVCKEKLEVEPISEIGSITCCPGCYADLKISSFNPLKLEEDLDSNENDYYDGEEDD